jgi:hypothetical protein
LRRKLRRRWVSLRRKTEVEKDVPAALCCLAMRLDEISNEIN